MGAFFTMTKQGKCDVIVTLYNKDNSVISTSSRTFDIKPTIKELREEYKSFKLYGATQIRISTTPSCNTKLYKL